MPGMPWNRTQTIGLTITLLVALNGCSLMPRSEPAPTKPTIRTIPSEQLVSLTLGEAKKLTCFTQTDAKKLGAYILALER